MGALPLNFSLFIPKSAPPFHQFTRLLIITPMVGGSRAGVFVKNHPFRAIFLNGRGVCEEACKAVPPVLKEMDFLKKKTQNKEKIFFLLLS